ncbi:hypothetical protein JCM10449v2_002297 [Rhodotorula kratochvilovae]
MAPSGGQKPLRRQLYLTIAAVCVLHLVCWRAATPLRSLAASRRSAPPAPHLARRTLGHTEPPVDDDGGALIDWLALWDQTAPGGPRAALLAVMVLWLTFLFAFVGICASEFFCPNLSHIASRLGLSESVAGVTFLAFSNGSPDVFSTFAALRTDSGSLAIGELIGAASFIVSVVAGTMALITPFRVSRRTFLRDVGFFTLAVCITLGILWDSHIHLWEALLMVALYVVYVLVVAVGTWWESRQEEKRRRLRDARSEYGEEDLDVVADGDVEWEGLARSHPASGASTPRSTHSQSYRSASPAYSSSTIVYHSSFASPPPSPSPSRSRAQSIASFSGAAGGGISARPAPTPLSHARRRSRSVRPSLLGAIEFRDVVNSLSADRSSAANVLAVFGGAHQHHAHAQSHEALEEAEDEMGLGFGGGRQAQGRRRALSQPNRPGALTLGGGDDDVLAEGVLREAEQRRRGRLPLGDRRTTWTGPTGAGSDSDEEEAPLRARNGLIDLSAGVDDPWKGARSPLTDEHGGRIKRVPSILLTTDSGSDTILADPPSPPAGDRDGRDSPSRRTPHPPRKHHLLHAARCALFPSLQSFRSKSLLGKCTALLCVPALLVLNLTLPVVEEPSDDGSHAWTEEKFVATPGLRVESRHVDAGSSSDEDEEDASEDVDGAIERIGHALHSPAVAAHPHARVHDDSPAHRLQHVRAAAAEAEGPHGAWAEVATPPLATAAGAGAPMDYFRVVSASEASAASRVNSAEGEGSAAEEKSEEEREWRAQEAVTRWLTALQCALGPVFCVVALLADELRWWYPLVALASGGFFSLLAYRFFKSSRHPGRIILCFLGFFIAMVWILMIVNEVVGVLQTFGHIFGISDAILGLTIFAMGNSLGDLVANATRMGYPAMAIAACFGGPMLNILLGVGLSGTYLILFDPSHRGQQLYIDMNRTLLVSGVGLFAILVGTLIVVPLNSYRMSKSVGAALILAYLVVLSTNVAVEIWL